MELLQQQRAELAARAERQQAWLAANEPSVDPDGDTRPLPLREADKEVDTTPLCMVCGWPMEWTGEEREVELEGGEFIVFEPVYRCVNPDCDDEGDEN